MDREHLAERIRNACVETLIQAYDDAGIQGLCAEGRWEVAVDALRHMDVAALVRQISQRAAE